MGKTYILNPTPLLMIGNPKKRKRVKTNKSKSHGGEKEMSKKRHHAKKAKSNPKRHRRVVAKSNPKTHRSVKVNHRIRRAVAKANPKRRHRYVKNPIVVRHRMRRVKSNPDFMKIGLEGLKFGGLVTIGMIGTSLVPQYVLSALNVQNQGIAKYGSELVTGGVLAWVSSLFKQNFEIPILAGAIATVLIQGLGDVIGGIGNNMKISGYGYLPSQQVPNQIGAGSYGQFNVPAVNQVANGVYA